MELDTSQVMVVGGLVNNILAPPYVSKHHAEKVSRQQIKFIKTTTDYSQISLGSVPARGPFKSVETVLGIHNQQ